MFQPQPFGKYTLFDRLAVGGMAEIFLAKPQAQASMRGRYLVIKRILPHFSHNQQFVDMFIDEAKISAQLKHDNVVPLYDLGKIGENYFLTMEWVPGQDLKGLLTRCRELKLRLSYEHAAFITSEMLKGLAYAHERTDAAGRAMHIVHRDVSPQNILVGYDGRVKVTDFGIAKAESKLDATAVGTLKGKFGYMAPEQVVAGGPPLDHRADIFAAGIILWELLTGHRLFGGRSEIEILEKVRAARIEPPSSIVPDVPRELEKIVFRALVKDRDKRYAHASEMQADIARFLATHAPGFGHANMAAAMAELFPQELENVRTRWEVEISVVDVAHVEEGARLEASRPDAHQPARTPPAQPASAGFHPRNATPPPFAAPATPPPTRTPFDEPLDMPAPPARPAQITQPATRLPARTAISPPPFADGGAPEPAKLNPMDLFDESPFDESPLEPTRTASVETTAKSPAVRPPRGGDVAMDDDGDTQLHQPGAVPVAPRTGGGEGRSRRGRTGIIVLLVLVLAAIAAAALVHQGILPDPRQRFGGAAPVPQTTPPEAAAADDAVRAEPSGEDEAAAIGDPAEAATTPQKDPAATGERTPSASAGATPDAPVPAPTATAGATGSATSPATSPASSAAPTATAAPVASPTGTRPRAAQPTPASTSRMAAAPVTDGEANRGYLSLDVVDGWGEVWVDGERISGSTPVSSVPLMPGLRRVRVVNPVSRAERTVEVRIEAGVITIERVRLGP